MNQLIVYFVGALVALHSMQRVQARLAYLAPVEHCCVGNALMCSCVRTSQAVRNHHLQFEA